MNLELSLYQHKDNPIENVFDMKSGILLDIFCAEISVSLGPYNLSGLRNDHGDADPRCAFVFRVVRMDQW